MAKLIKIVHDNRAEKILRFLNYIIDFIFCYFLIIIFYALSAFIYALITGESFEEVAEKLGNINKYVDRIMTFALYVLLMFLFEYLTKGRSLGKFITGTIVVKADGTSLTSRDYFLRNLSRAIPFDFVSFLGQNGWHDTATDTRVVKKKNYEEAQIQKSDLENLGKTAL